MSDAERFIGVGMARPTIARWGTDEQQVRYLPGIDAGRDIWCQLFSEPGSGSDLAGLATRAVRDGEGWIVTGQKVWTSVAHRAAHGLLLARTDPTAAKHRGITFFVLDMGRPGVTVRPLRHLTGEAEFNEVFLDGVRIPDGDRVGPVDGGWEVALTTLMNERSALSGEGSSGGSAPGGGDVHQLVRRFSPVAHPVLRQRLVDAWAAAKVLSLTNLRFTADRRGDGPGPEGSVTKLQQAVHNRAVQRLAVDLEGAAALAWLDAGGSTEWDGPYDRPAASVHGFLRATANTIEGGTSEVLRTMIGERILGLPKEPDPARGRPWSEIPRS